MPRLSSVATYREERDDIVTSEPSPAALFVNVMANGLLVASTLLEPCPCAGLSGSSGSPFAWFVSAGMSLLPGASPVSRFPHSATLGALGECGPHQLRD
jgi:hypothetical protein